MRGSVERVWFGAMLAAGLCAGLAHAEDPLVTIEGGVDDTLQNYEWMITNHHSSAIDYVEFPHHLAGLFITPPKWRQKTTNLVGSPTTNEKSVCIAEAEPDGPGIPRGGAQSFGMQIAPTGTPAGRGAVKIRFRDGKEITVTNVEVPVAPPTSRNLSLIGAALIFGGYVLYRTVRDTLLPFLRRRRRRSEERSAESDRTTET